MTGHAIRYGCILSICEACLVAQTPAMLPAAMYTAGLHLRQRQLPNLPRRSDPSISCVGLLRHTLISNLRPVVVTRS